MSFPDVSVSIPSLNPNQYWFGGMTMGSGTVLTFQKVEGLDQPDVRTGDSGRPRTRGMFRGLDVLGGRQITLTGKLVPTLATYDSWLALANAAVPGGVTEYPFFFNLPTFGTLVSMARVRKRSMPIDLLAAIGKPINVGLMFAASDPALYGATVSQSVSPPPTVGGLTVPLVVPVVITSGSSAGALSVINPGNIDCPAIMTITGPCTNPSVTNASIPGSPTLAFALSLNAGDTLVLDTDMQTATYFSAGSTSGSSRGSNRVPGSQWFTIWPANGEPGTTVTGGINQLQFLTGDSVATGTLTVESAPAYIL